MAGGRRVDDDEVGRPLALEFLDLAEHEEMLEPGGRRGDHRQRRGRRGAAQQPADAPQVEVVTERLVDRDRPATHLAGTRDPLQDAIGVVERAAAEQRSHPGSPVDRDEQHVGTVACGGERVGRGDRR